ncbi:2-oxo acid dehydrogenase subunit E2 [Gammaproteobacteria bacterium LSUCC0112]|nr:2-oxo acid dehydrogenase subunit E2 [Gammaproteobacteria bacterium LSUCC0112]
MKFFKLPDLGEGLQEAEIVEWHVHEGDEVNEDQLVLSVETAKAIVDIPSPQAGRIGKLFGKAGDLIHVGTPLLEYVDAEDDDTGTVVGKMQTAGTSDVLDEDFIIGSPPRADDPWALKGVQRVMAQNMAKAHTEVVKVTLFDDVDVDNWAPGEDATMRLVRAIAAGCAAEPKLNAWFDGRKLSLRLLPHIDLGIAVDTEQGLFVPVLRNITGRSREDLRTGLDNLRAAVNARSIPAAEMTGATITLSNFGMLAGRYASPVIVPPMVAILGAGRIRREPVAIKISGEEQVAIHRVLPLSLSFDHRAASGGEAARFLAAVMKDLAAAD